MRVGAGSFAPMPIPIPSAGAQARILAILGATLLLLPSSGARPLSACRRPARFLLPGRVPPHSSARGAGDVSPLRTASRVAARRAGMAVKASEDGPEPGAADDAVVDRALAVIRGLRSGSTIGEATEEVAEAVKTLVGTQHGIKYKISDFDWRGSWRVFYAPHIRTLSSLALGTGFDVQYVIGDEVEGEESSKRYAIRSNVRYSNPVAGSGWLVSSGEVYAEGPQLSIVNFDEFWVDAGDGGTNVPQKPEIKKNFLRTLVNDVGRAGFIADISRFPVLFLKDDVCVFKFPPLNVMIAARRE